MPNALIEAVALGVKVVSTDCESGPKEIVKTKELGELVPIDDPIAMSNSIIRQLQNNTPTNLEYQLEEFNQDKILSQYCAAIRSIKRYASESAN